MRKTIKVSTKRGSDIIDITEKIQEFLTESEIESGIIHIFSRHTTSGLTIMEYETGAIQDLKESFEKIAPVNKSYNHNELQNDDNGNAHVSTSLMGSSLTIPFEDKKLLLGTWQRIVLIDFDTQARTREVVISIIKEN